MKFVFGAGALLCLGCIPYTQSPPPGLVALEAAQTLGEGQIGVQVTAGGGIGADLALGAFSARVRYGIVEHLDLRFEASVVNFNPDLDDGESFNGSTAIGSASAGIKYAVNPYFALAFDLHGGGWVGGGFMSPQLRLIAAYENKRAVPFIDAGYYTSHPISPNVVTTNVAVLGPPVFTHGWTTALGIRIVTSSFDCCRAASALLLGSRVTGSSFRDTEGLRESRAYWTGGGAVEVVFPGRR